MRTLFVAQKLIAFAAMILISGAAQALVMNSDVEYCYDGTCRNADDSKEQAGNHSVSDINGLFSGDSWTAITKDEDPFGDYAGVRFTLGTNANGSTSGNFTLSWQELVGGSLPLEMDFVLVVKAADYFGAYLFSDQLFGTNPLSGSGSFSVSWLNNGGQTPGLSHLALYGRNPTSVEVPEPAALSLLVLGLAGLTTLRRRHKQA